MSNDRSIRRRVRPGLHVDRIASGTSAQELQWPPKHSARRVYVLSLVDAGWAVTACSDDVNSQTLGGCLRRSPRAWNVWPISLVVPAVLVGFVRVLITDRLPVHRLSTGTLAVHRS